MDGAIEPIPCSPGASCPEGSDRSLTLLPFGMLVMVNFLMIMWILAARYMSKRRSSRKKRPRSLMGAVRDVQSIVDINQRHKRYGSAVDPDIVLESRISAVKRENTGFLAVVDNDWVGEEFVSQDEKPSTDMQLFVQSMSKCINGASFGLSFEFDDLQFQPKGGNPILSQITGKIDSGALWAIMGASGAGKTTFVNVLMGKIKNTGGITRVNGVAGKISKYKKIIGYVPQDDIVLPELTVRENILHSAKVRLPSSWTDAEVQHHVDVLISCLQLTHVRDSLVGSPAKPVISGGQRKRVSIGIELAAAPMALFLDEPTSGLDATSAASIMQTLKSLSRLGITVVTIIHQPRQEIFESIDNLILLGAGRMIYQGKTSEVASYFNNIGFTFPQNVNPADVLMDIIAGSGRMYKRIGDVGLEALIEHWSGSRNGSSRPSSVEISMTKEDVVALRNSIKSRGAAVHKQIWFCLTRAMLQQARSISSFYFELGVGALSGFLIGLSQMSQRGNNFKGVFYPPFTPLSSAANFSSVAQMALLVGVAIGLTASAPGVRVFGEEKLIYYREAASGHNRFAYYSGKVLSTMPRMILANLHFTVMFLLLSTPQMSFGATFIANFAYFYCVYGLASIVSVLTKREDGPLLAVMASLIVSVLNGMSPRLQQIAEWRLEWLWRLIPGTWLAEAYFDKNVSPWKHLYILDIVTDATGYTLGQFSLDVGILFLLGTAYRVVAFLALRFHNRGQQV
jgi:ABC-type multidrug transport system ATPase subunit